MRGSLGMQMMARVFGTGGIGDDSLNGGSGRDGGEGADGMYGGTGNDLCIVDDVNGRSPSSWHKGDGWEQRQRRIIVERRLAGVMLLKEARADLARRCGETPSEGTIEIGHVGKTRGRSNVAHLAPVLGRV